jgi:hypothetical protein
MMVTFALLSCVIAGYVFGRLHERIKWNELITKGILPKPKG